MSTTNNTFADNTFADNIVRYDLHKRCTHCMRRGYLIENCAYKKEEDEEKILLLSPCEHCSTMGHIKRKCPLIPDSPRTKSRKYQEYTDKEDYQGAAEYLQDQLNKKYALMTPEELDAHFEDISD